MSAVNLDTSIQRLRECYVGKDDAGTHTLDSKKIDSLAFSIALHRVRVALENKEITEEDFIKKITKKENKK
jgi:hypothetical protein